MVPRALLRGYDGWRAYAIGALFVALVATVRYLARDVVRDEMPLLPFVLAVLAASVVGGFRAGLLTTALSAAVGELLFARPYGEMAFTNVPATIRCVVFVFDGLFVSSVIQYLRDARLAALRANEEKDAFIAMLAHEFRNPISAVQTALGVMKNRQSEERRTWARDLIERQTTVMSRLVTDLLDASHIKRQTLDHTHRQPSSVQPILESAIAAVQPLIAERDLRFDADLGDEDAIVMVDAIRLQQAVTNLLTNACRYTPPGGHVSMALDVGSTVTITVRDTGIGINSTDLDRLFEPFQRGPASTGLGLGLYLARTFVQCCGGTLHATSTGAGAGSTFVIRLPLLRREAHPIARAGRSA